jgi:hypothetical protein
LRWRWVQDGVATRGIFAGSCHSGLSTCRAHHAVVGGLGASRVSFWLVSPLCGAGRRDLLVEPIRWLNPHDRTRRAGGRGWPLGAAHQQDDDTDGQRAVQSPRETDLAAIAALGTRVGCVSIYALPSKLLLRALHRIPGPHDGPPAGVISYRFAR